MTQSNVSQDLTQSFDNTSPSASSTPCCKEVKGRWVSFEIVRGGVERTGDFEVKEVPPSRQYVTPGFKFTQPIKIDITVKGKVVCTCADDGRVLGTKEIERSLPPIKVPLSYTLAGKLPLVGMLYVAKDLQTIDRTIKSAGSDPQAAEDLNTLSGGQFSKKLNEVKNSADTICKSIHKCAGTPAGDSETPTS
jgi:hypothetical protein